MLDYEDSDVFTTLKDFHNSELYIVNTASYFYNTGRWWRPIDFFFRLQLAARKEKVAREKLDFLIAFGEALNNLESGRPDLLSIQAAAAEILKKENPQDLWDLVLFLNKNIFCWKLNQSELKEFGHFWKMRQTTLLHFIETHLEDFFEHLRHSLVHPLKQGCSI